LRAIKRSLTIICVLVGPALFHFDFDPADVARRYIVSDRGQAAADGAENGEQNGEEANGKGSEEEPKDSRHVLVVRAGERNN